MIHFQHDGVYLAKLKQIYNMGIIHFQHDCVYLAKENVGKIKKGELIQIVGYPYGETVVCKNLNGDEETFEEEYQFTGFGVNLYNHNILEVIEEDLKNDRYYMCLEHLSEHVKSAKDHYKLHERMLHTTFFDKHNVVIKAISEPIPEEKACEYLIEEILYGAQPELQGRSCVGTTAKGIDKDPNYHNGNYTLADGENYTMTYCHGKIKIKKGHDGGWYSGGNPMPIIYEGEIDWDRMKEARIRKAVDCIFKKNTLFTKEHPDVAELVYEKIKGLDRFKLNREYPEGTTKY